MLIRLINERERFLAPSVEIHVIHSCRVFSMLRNLRPWFVYQQGNNINAFAVFPETAYAYDMKTQRLTVDGKTISNVVAVELIEKASSVDDAIRQSSIYKFSVALLQAANDRADQLLGQFAQLQAQMITQVQSEWLSKKDFAKYFGKSTTTLDRWRRDPEMGLTEGIHWQKTGGEIEFNTEVMNHWRNNLQCPIAHTDWLRDRAASMKKRGRKRSA